MKFTKYDSRFEKSLHAKEFKDFVYHPITITFNVPRSYTPDFSIDVGDFTYYIETKGYIYTSEGARLLVEASKNFKEQSELIFVFQDPGKQLKWQQKRKDGTKMALCEWADKNKFRWYSRDDVFVLNFEIKNRLKDEKKRKHHG